ncbi:MAG: AMP-binding protein [Halioglobus sp.]
MPQPAPAITRLQDIPQYQAQRQPDATALWWEGEAISYAALQARIHALTRRLAASGPAGERIAVLAWNCPEFVELLYAVPAAGKILVPLNARLAPAELTWQLQHSGARLVFADAGLRATHLPQPVAADSPRIVEFGEPHAQWLASGPCSPPPRTAVDDPAWILYTSGSTGRPRGAVLTHRSFLAGLASAALARPVQPGDRYYYPFPLFHVAAHNVLLQHRHGAAVVLAPSFEASAALTACRELRVTSMSLAPTMLAMLLDHPDFRPEDLSWVRSIGYGASAMPVTLLRRLLRETAVDLCQSYGMTELSGSVAFLTAEDHRAAAESQPGLLKSVGRVLPTAEVRIADDAGDTLPCGAEGEILVRAEQCMAGYWQDPAATDAALAEGWLRTGDIGRFDSGGYLYIVDRKKDMLISGGENIASREVEEVLRTHPAVADCAVIGLPDARWGERVCAVLVLREDATDDALAAHCRAQLAGYKTPRQWHRRASLPLNAAGKVDKPALRNDYGGADSGP